MEIGIDQDMRHALLKDGVVRLPRLEYRLFELLMSNSGKVFSKNEIGAALWGTDIPDTTIEKLVSRLRERIGRKSLETRRSFGYSINASQQQTILQDSRALPEHKRGYLYVMSIGFDNLYKIGFSNNPVRRCIAGSAFNPRLKLLVYGTSKKARENETKLHKSLEKFSVDRELFRLTEGQLSRVVNAINSL